jgi:hypothetical protein
MTTTEMIVCAGIGLMLVAIGLLWHQQTKDRDNDDNDWGRL